VYRVGLHMKHSLHMQKTLLKMHALCQYLE